MRRHLLHLCAAVLMLASAAAQSAVINTGAVSITYNDNESFGSFSANFENSFFGTTFGNLFFDAVSNVSSGGQSNNSTSLILLTIKAAPGYALDSVGFSETGNWATSNSGSVGVSAQGGILVDCNVRIRSDAMRRVAVYPLHGIGCVVVLADVAHELSP